MVSQLHDLCPCVTQHGFTLDFGLSAFIHFLHQRVKGINTFARHNQVIEFLAERVCEQTGVRCCNGVS